MAYKKTSWVDNTTAITAERLNNMEEGIESANEILPDNQGLTGQVLTKTDDGAEWADVATSPTVVGEVLEL
jgi:hypothetical protein